MLDYRSVTIIIINTGVYKLLFVSLREGLAQENHQTFAIKIRHRP